jgi:hypothetical protein
MSSPSNLLMLGLKGSGKTTYLAALWHYLESAEIGDRLVIPRLQPDRDYLNAIRNSWLALRPLERTSMRTKSTASLRLHDSKRDADVVVTVPDLSGESFRLQWFTRKAATSYVEFAKNCTGAFLFIHPEHFRRTHAIKAKSLDEDNTDVLGAETAIPISEHWTPEQSSTQVQLVELLQLLLGLIDDVSGVRLAVVISAWDLIEAPVSATNWLERRLPLLSQFLRANSDWLPSEVFGVSSQGGDLDTDRDKLMNSTTASARCMAIRGDSLETVSITAPLQFLLNI